MRFPTAEGIIRLHGEILAATGGEPGLLMRGAIEAAVHRAEWGPFQGPADVAEGAAFLVRGLTLDHSFADGNKRIAFTAADTFLSWNGFRLQIDEEEGERFMLELAWGEHGVEEIALWIRRGLRQR